MKHPARTALVTGCSTGIGRAVALALHARGLVVYATARKPQSLEDLHSAGLRTAALDVDSESSIQALLQRLEQDGAVVDLLVNNAGFGAMGPLAELPLAQLQRQFQTHVFSLMAVTQALLPPMFDCGSGCIVNIGSVSGVTTTPFSGAYCASKAAVHALSDALRMELAPFGIRVITVQPGGIQSDFGTTATAALNATSHGTSSRFAALSVAIADRASASQNGAMPAERFARQLVDAVLASRPPSILRIGKHSRVLPALARLPTRARDALLSRLFGLDRLRLE
jgi:short-subunit dehydrogenase